MYPPFHGPIETDCWRQCIEPSWVPAQNWVPVELPPGGMLLFGSFLAHRSGPNLSTGWRAGIYATVGDPAHRPVSPHLRSAPTQYNAASDGGDKHDSYYATRRRLWPPTWERKPDQKYEEGALIFACGFE